MGLFKTVAEGGQIWAHRVRMLRQVLKTISLISFTTAGLVFTGLIIQIPKVYYQSVWYYGKSKVLKSQKTTWVDSSFWAFTSHQRHSKKDVLVPVNQLEKVSKRMLPHLVTQISNSFVIALNFSKYGFYLVLSFFFIKGVISRKKKHIEGQRISSAFQLAMKLKFNRTASFLRLGALPLIKNAETRHILVTGGSGSGKTNSFHHLLPTIRSKGHKAIIIDTTGEYIAKYYRAGKDIIINPYDHRSVQWHPWCECSEPYDYKALAQSFIPLSTHEDDNFWRKAAQEVFCSALGVKNQEQKLSSLTQLLLYDPLPVLADYLQDTKAGAFLDPKSDKTSASVRAVAASFLECLELFEDTKTPFSMKAWVQDESQDNWVFIASTPGQRASLTPLISALFSIGMRSLLQMTPDKDRRLWFIADELASLQRLMDLETCLTESRKYGGCALLALQSPAQLEMIYGRHLSRIIIGNCDTRVAFSEKDPQIAEEISKTFGQKETKEFQEAISYGAHEMRDGVNLSSQTKTSPVISPTAIQSLTLNEAYIRLPGNLPITKVKLKFQERPKVAEPFEKKVADLTVGLASASIVES